MSSLRAARPHHGARLPVLRGRSANVRAEHDALLKAIAGVMKNHAFVIEVRGHIDSKEKGWKLAERRAKAVKKALVALDVAEDRLVIRDLGATEPLSPEPHKNAYVNFEIIEQPATD